jgi:hypothetical protein
LVEKVIIHINIVVRTELSKFKKKSDKTFNLFSTLRLIINKNISNKMTYAGDDNNAGSRQQSTSAYGQYLGAGSRGSNYNSSYDRVSAALAAAQAVPANNPCDQQTYQPPPPQVVLRSCPEQHHPVAPKSEDPCAQQTYLSEIEAAILRSSVPINVNETDEITVFGQRGIWTNKSEVQNWKGDLPISQYQING